MGDRLPVATWLHGYQREWLRADIIAGLTVWALVVPQAIAYAQIAGLPPKAGIFAAFAAPLGYALFGTSRQLIVSPTSATAAISAALVAPLVVSDPDAYWEMSAALAILCGLAFLLLGRLQLGWISQFIATSVQAGFLFGLGMTIIVGQLFKVFGIDGNDGPFYKQAWYLVQHLDETSGWTLAIGLSSLVALLVLRRAMPAFPAALLLVALAILIVSLFDLAGKGVAIVGEIDRAMVLPAIPTVPLDDLLTLIPGVLAIVVIGYSESISVAQGFADKHRYEIRPNRELIALGSSSIVGGLFQGFITGGGASQSAANDRAGAKTQMAGVILALLAALTAIALLPVFENLPMAVLGAIVISAVLGFLNVPELRRIRALSQTSFILALIALFGVLVLGILPGLLITVALSILLLLSRISRPAITELGRLPGTAAFAGLVRHDEAMTTAGLLILRLDGPLFFINASWMRDALRETMEGAPDRPSVVALDLEATNTIDIRSLDVLAAFQRECAENDVELWLANVHDAVRDGLLLSDFDTALPKPNIFRSLVEAEQAYLQRIGRAPDTAAVENEPLNARPNARPPDEGQTL